MFWHLNDAKDGGASKSIPSKPELLFQLTEQVRSEDASPNYVLRCDREGAEPWEVYCFIHGSPTRNVGSWLSDEVAHSCGRKSCADLQQSVWKQQLQNPKVTWLEMQSLECQVCKRERRRRCQMLAYKGDPGVSESSTGMLPTEAVEEEHHRYAAFAAAPYIHPYNQPKYRLLFKSRSPKARFFLEAEF